MGEDDATKRRHSAIVNEPTLPDIDRPRSKSNPKGTNKRKRRTHLDHGNASKYFNKSLPKLPQHNEEKRHFHHHNCPKSASPTHDPTKIHVAQPLVMPFNEICDEINLPNDPFECSLSPIDVDESDQKYSLPSRPQSAKPFASSSHTTQHRILTPDVFIKRSRSASNFNTTNK